MPARGVAALGVAIRFDLLLLSAAALPGSWQCGLITVYLSTPQCGERSNAAFRTQSAAVLTSFAPHDSKARLIPVTSRRDSWRSHVHRTRLRSACSYSSCKPAMSGVEGGSPRPFSWGCKGDILFREREYPPFPRPPHGVGDNRVRPAGAKREAPLRVLPFYSTVTDFARLRGLSISHPRWSAI